MHFAPAARTGFGGGRLADADPPLCDRSRALVSEASLGRSVDACQSIVSISPLSSCACFFRQPLPFARCPGAPYVRWVGSPNGLTARACRHMLGPNRISQVIKHALWACFVALSPLERLPGQEEADRDRPEMPSKPLFIKRGAEMLRSRAEYRAIQRDAMPQTISRSDFRHNQD